MNLSRAKCAFALVLSGLCWLLATGLTAEAALQGTVTSWTLIFSMPVLTAAIALLFHQAFEDLRDVRLLRAGAGMCLACLGLAVTLPNSIGTSAGVRDTSVAQATEVSGARAAVHDELDQAKKSRDDAKSRASKACKSNPSGDICSVWSKREKAYQALVEKFVDKVAETPVEAATAGDLRLAGESRLVWLAGRVGLPLTAQDVEMGQPVLAPLVLELLCPYFLALGLRRRQAAIVPVAIEAKSVEIPKEKAAIQPATPPKKKRKLARKDKVADFVKTYKEKNGIVPRFRLVQNRFHLPASTASRYRTAALAAA